MVCDRSVLSQGFLGMRRQASFYGVLEVQGGRWWDTTERPLRRNAQLARKDEGDTPVVSKQPKSQHMVPVFYRGSGEPVTSFPMPGVLSFALVWSAKCKGGKVSRPVKTQREGSQRHNPLSLLSPSLLPISSCTQECCHHHVFSQSTTVPRGEKRNSPPYNETPLPSTVATPCLYSSK